MNMRSLSNVPLRSWCAPNLTFSQLHRERVENLGTGVVAIWKYLWLIAFLIQPSLVQIWAWLQRNSFNIPRLLVCAIVKMELAESVNHSKEMSRSSCLGSRKLHYHSYGTVWFSSKCKRLQLATLKWKAFVGSINGTKHANNKIILRVHVNSEELKVKQ